MFFFFRKLWRVFYMSMILFEFGFLLQIGELKRNTSEKYLAHAKAPPLQMLAKTILCVS
jgi:hypothetical protein